MSLFNDAYIDAYDAHTRKIATVRKTMADAEGEVIRTYQHGIDSMPMVRQEAHYEACVRLAVALVEWEAATANKHAVDAWWAGFQGRMATVREMRRVVAEREAGESAGDWDSQGCSRI